MNWFGLKQRLAAIDLLVLDVDGVQTDGGLIYSDDGVVQRAHLNWSASKDYGRRRRSKTL